MQRIWFTDGIWAPPVICPQIEIETQLRLKFLKLHQHGIFYYKMMRIMYLEFVVQG